LVSNVGEPPKEERLEELLVKKRNDEANQDDLIVARTPDKKPTFVTTRTRSSCFHDIVQNGCVYARRCWGIPSLYRPGAGQRSPTTEFEDSCILVLVILSTDTHSDGRWMLARNERMKLLAHIEDACGNQDGKLSYDELMTYLEDGDHQREIRELPFAARGLLVRELVWEIFQEVDRDVSHKLDKTEWSDFLGKLEERLLGFLLMESFQQFRAFYGRGQARWDIDFDQQDKHHNLVHDLSKTYLSPTHPSMHRRRCAEFSDLLKADYSLIEASRQLPTFQCGLDSDRLPGWNPLPPGWWEDFCLYVCNHSALFGVFACDEHNALSWFERLFIEIGCVGMTVFTVNRHTEYVERQTPPEYFPWMCNEYLFSICMSTIPGIVYWWMLFALFTCPMCGMVNAAHSTPDQVARAKRWTGFGEFLGYAIVCLAIATIGHGIGNAKFTTGMVLVLLKGRIRAYFISGLVMLLVLFNPFISWGQRNPDGPFCFGDMIGLGQWRVEKQLFQQRCKKIVLNLELTV